MSNNLELWNLERKVSQTVIKRSLLSVAQHHTRSPPNNSIYIQKKKLTLN